MTQTPETTSADTICAIATPHGIGGIAVIRISGPHALAAADSIWQGKSLSRASSHTAHLGHIIDRATNQPVDQAVATIFRAPRSYTGEDTVELSIHGSVWLQQQVLELLTQNKDLPVRIARAGEFTRRAFVNGNIDLVQAEAVGDLISAQTKAAARAALTQMRGLTSQSLAQLRERLLELASLLELELDFSEEDVQFADRTHLTEITRQIHARISELLSTFRTGQAIKNGIPVAIIGPTNAGKSSLLNILTGDNRAIVSDIHGTTRDIIEDTLTLDGHQFRLMDTAGLRRTTDTIEQLGIDRTRQAARKASIILIVNDATAPQPITEQLPEDAHIINLLNKTDLLTHPCPDTDNTIHISAKTGLGIDLLKQRLTDITREDTAAAGDIVITNLRHARALSQALEATDDTLRALDDGLSGDLVAQHLRMVIHHLGTITGAITTPEILSTIFSRFCIGK